MFAKDKLSKNDLSEVVVNRKEFVGEASSRLDSSSVFHNNFKDAIFYFTASTVKAHREGPHVSIPPLTSSLLYSHNPSPFHFTFMASKLPNQSNIRSLESS